MRRFVLQTDLSTPESAHDECAAAERRHRSTTRCGPATRAAGKRISQAFPARKSRPAANRNLADLNSQQSELATNLPD